MKNIGIIGRGFVGSAVEFGFSAQTGCDTEIRAYDKNPAKSINTLEETVNCSDFIFLSVPTPSNPDGGNSKNTSKVAKMYKWRFGNSVPCIETNFQTAEMIKYMNNCFFATKVSFLNEMKQVSDECGVDWEKAIDGFVRDGRVGHTHLAVPGPDGKCGFGGSCFPKDVQAMIDFGESLDVSMNTLKGVWDTNLEVRPERDWEKLKGRSVIEQ